MKHPARLVLFCAGAAGVAVIYGLACARSLGPAAARDRYAEAINGRAVQERNVTDAVTAVNFDYRGFDTLGEEFILFVSVMGAHVLLRETDKQLRPQRRAALQPRRRKGPSEALQVWTLGMTGPTVLFGIYMVTHGSLTPGGGFQGGVILATAPLLILLAENYEVFKRVTSHRWLEAAEASGVGAYVLVGLIALLYGAAYLTNVLPLGTSGEPTSGGTIGLINLATGLEVAAGFTLLLSAFLQEALAEQEAGR